MGLKTIRARFVGLVAAAVVVAGCGSSEGPGGGETGTIAITVTPTALSIVQGGSGTVAASITRGGGFTGTVTVVTEGAPAGVTAAVSNVTTSGTTTSGTVTVTVGGSVAPGTYPLTVRATGSGVTAVTATVTLTVTAIPAIALSVNPTTVSVVVGASGTAAVTIARTNFTGDVTLTLEGSPAGVTGTFNPAVANATTSTLTLAVGGAVAPGTYPLTIRGTGTGITAATTPVSLTVTAVPVPSFEIAPVVPDPKTLTQGTAGDVAVTLTRTNGFAGTVNLTLEGAPAGVTGAFAPAAVTATTSTLTLTVGAAVAAGNYTLTVRGAATGQTDKTRTFVLTVAAIPASYTLTTTPTGPVTVQQSGSVVNVTVNVNRTNFPGTVNLAVTGNPAGLTATIPATTTANTVTLALSATTGVAVGSYTLTITGTATGLTNQTATLGVNVTAASTGGGNITVDFTGCTAEQRPIWLAVQNGTGPWTVVTPVGFVYSFTVSAGKAGMAWVTDPAGSAFLTLISYFSQAEWASFPTTQFCGTTTATKSLKVQTAGLTGIQQALISLGNGSGSANATQSLATLNNVLTGTYDLVGSSFDPLQTSPSRIFLARDVNTAATAEGGTVPVTADFNDATNSFAPATALITIGGAAGDEIIAGMSYQTLGTTCQSASLFNSLASAAVTSFTASGVPTAKRRSTDLHGLSVTAVNGLATFRTVIDFFGVLADRTVQLPSVIPVFTPSNLGGNYKTLRFQFTLPSDLTQSASVNYFELSGTKSVIITATNGWLGGTAVDVAMPAFSGLAGWSDTWAPASAGTAQWTAGGIGGTLAGACAAGTVASSTRQGQVP